MGGGGVMGRGGGGNGEGEGEGEGGGLFAVWPISDDPAGQRE